MTKMFIKINFAENTPRGAEVFSPEVLENRGSYKGLIDL
jgi:hypothetical protein